MSHGSDNLNDDLNDKEDLIRAIKTIIQLYADKAHFIYELLQNAEDSKATKVSFAMFADRLEVLHNGEPFTQANLTSLRSVALTTKVEEVNAIGKFGVGFKSVFGICKAVILCCDKRNFEKQNDSYLEHFVYKITDFRYIEPVKTREVNIKLPDEYTTKYIFPFCVNEDFSGYKKMETLHENLSKRLKELGASVLLFMRNIKEISYSITEIRPEWNGNGTYILQKDKIGENCFRISAIGESESDDVNYLMYSRPTSYRKDVNIAFACRWDRKGAPVFSVSPEKHICVYFPTDTPSDVNFVVQAPYGTTPNRGGIPVTEENTCLTEELAVLLHNAVLDIRNRKWLTLEFLNLLPIDNTKNYGLLELLHKKIISLVNNESILPAITGSYTNKENARIVRGEKIAKLFCDKKLHLLTGNKNAEWMPVKLTDQNPRLKHLYSILTDQISVKIIQASHLPALLRENVRFWEHADNNWLISFYQYLFDEQKSMLGRHGYFLTVPFIKTMNDTFVAPYIYDQKIRSHTPNVFIFPKNARKLIGDLNFVNGFITEQCAEFLDAMGIYQPDGYTYLIAELDNKYNDNEISEDDLISQLKQAIRYLKAENHDNAANEFRNKLLLRYIATNSGKTMLSTCASTQLYRKYDSKTNLSILEYFSETSANFGILDEDFYTENGIEIKNILEKLGVKSTVVDFGNNEWYDGAKCWNSDKFKRWLNFDGISSILNCINNGNKAKSVLLFTMLKSVEKHLTGVYLRNQNRHDRHEDESEILKAIKTHRWLYDGNGRRVRACDITRHELDTVLYGDADKYSKIYDIIGFKEDKADVILDQLKNLSFEQKQKILKNITTIVEIQDILEDVYDPTASENEEPPTEGIGNINRLKSKTIQAYNEAENVKYEYVMLSRRISGGGQRDHIKFRYKGFCQMCHKPNRYWEIAEVFPNPAKELEQMNLSLCPNCASEYRRIRNIPETMALFKLSLLNSEFCDNKVKLNDDTDLYFTQRHLAEVKIILEEMEKK